MIIVDSKIINKIIKNILLKLFYSIIFQAQNDQVFQTSERVTFYTKIRSVTS